jgi:hypothetical protein
MRRFEVISVVALLVAACSSADPPAADAKKDVLIDAAAKDNGSDQATADAAPSAMACAHVQVSCREETWRCAEYGEGDVAALEAACTASGDTFAHAPCPRAGAVGGCTFPKDAPCRNTWWYGPITPEIVHMTCGPSTFLMP